MIENVNAYFAYDEFFETYSLNFLGIEVINSRDLPAYVTGVNVVFSRGGGDSSVEAGPIMSGETETIEASNFIGLETDDVGFYTLNVELRDGVGWSRTVKESESTVQVE